MDLVVRLVRQVHLVLLVVVLCTMDGLVVVLLMVAVLCIKDVQVEDLLNLVVDHLGLLVLLILVDLILVGLNLVGLILVDLLVHVEVVHGFKLKLSIYWLPLSAHFLTLHHQLYLLKYRDLFVAPLVSFS